MVLGELKKRIGRAGSKGEKAKLNFCNCGINDQQLTFLLDILVTRPIISKLDLRGNDISNEGASRLLLLLKGQTKLVRDLDVDSRLDACFLGEVILDGSSRPIDASVMSTIKLTCDILKIANAQAYIRSLYIEHNGKQVRLKVLQARVNNQVFTKIWTEVVGKADRIIILRAFSSANLLEKTPLTYEELNDVIIHGLMNRGALDALNEWQLRQITPVASPQKPSANGNSSVLSESVYLEGGEDIKHWDPHNETFASLNNHSSLSGANERMDISSSPLKGDLLLSPIKPNPPAHSPPRKQNLFRTATTGGIDVKSPVRDLDEYRPFREELKEQHLSLQEEDDDDNEVSEDFQRHVAEAAARGSLIDRVARDDSSLPVLYASSPKHSKAQQQPSMDADFASTHSLSLSHQEPLHNEQDDSLIEKLQAQLDNVGSSRREVEFEREALPPSDEVAVDVARNAEDVELGGGFHDDDATHAVEPKAPGAGLEVKPVFDNYTFEQLKPALLPEPTQESHASPLRVPLQQIPHQSANSRIGRGGGLHTEIVYDDGASETDQNSSQTPNLVTGVASRGSKIPRVVEANRQDMDTQTDVKSMVSNFIRIPPTNRLTSLTVLIKANLNLTEIDFSDYLDPDQYSALKVLVLCNNALSSWDHLSLFSRFPYLCDLDLSSNGIMNAIPDYTLPTTLQRLDLSYNQITDIRPLILCVELEELNVSYNQIRAIHGLPAKLRKLDISYNRIGSIVSIRALGLSPELQSVTIEGNPIVNAASEWRVVLKTVLTKLVDIDGYPLPAATQRIKKKAEKSRVQQTMAKQSIPTAKMTKEEQKQHDAMRSKMHHIKMKALEESKVEYDRHQFEQLKLPKPKKMSKGDIDKVTMRLAGSSLSQRTSLSSTSAGSAKASLYSADPSPFLKNYIKVRNITDSVDDGDKSVNDLNDWLTTITQDISRAAAVLSLAIEMAKAQKLSNKSVKQFQQALSRVKFFPACKFPLKFEYVLKKLSPSNSLLSEVTSVREQIDHCNQLFHQIQFFLSQHAENPASVDFTTEFDLLMNTNSGHYVNLHVLQIYGTAYKAINVNAHLQATAMAKLQRDFANPDEAPTAVRDALHAASEDFTYQVQDDPLYPSRQTYSPSKSIFSEAMNHPPLSPPRSPPKEGQLPLKATSESDPLLEKMKTRVAERAKVVGSSIPSGAAAKQGDVKRSTSFNSKPSSIPIARKSSESSLSTAAKTSSSSKESVSAGSDKKSASPFTQLTRQLRGQTDSLTISVDPKESTLFPQLSTKSTTGSSSVASFDLLGTLKADISPDPQPVVAESPAVEFKSASPSPPPSAPAAAASEVAAETLPPKPPTQSTGLTLVDVASADLRASAASDTSEIDGDGKKMSAKDRIKARLGKSKSSDALSSDSRAGAVEADGARAQSASTGSELISTPVDIAFSPVTTPADVKHDSAKLGFSISAADPKGGIADDSFTSYKIEPSAAQPMFAGAAPLHPSKPVPEMLPNDGSIGYIRSLSYSASPGTLPHHILSPPTVPEAHDTPPLVPPKLTISPPTVPLFQPVLTMDTDPGNFSHEVTPTMMARDVNIEISTAMSLTDIELPPPPVTASLLSMARSDYDPLKGKETADASPKDTSSAAAATPTGESSAKLSIKDRLKARMDKNKKSTE